MPMTPGQQALAEAARLEQARIYSTTCRETEQEHRPAGGERDAAIAYYSHRGWSVASIAFRLGTTRRVVKDALERLAAAS